MARTLTKYQRDILIRTALGEAAGEGVGGMQAVIHVILNRADSGAYPSDPAEVALQNRGGVYQFSAWNSASNEGNNPWKYSKKDKDYKRASVALDRVLNSNFDPTYGAMFYHTTGVNPYWADSVNKHGTIKIGHHVFYAGHPVPPGYIPEVASEIDIGEYAPTPHQSPLWRLAQLKIDARTALLDSSAMYGVRAPGTYKAGDEFEVETPSVEDLSASFLYPVEGMHRLTGAQATLFDDVGPGPRSWFDTPDVAPGGLGTQVLIGSGAAMPAVDVPSAVPLPRRSPMIAPGNINLDARKVYRGADGSIRTENSISIGTDRGEVLIPTVVDGIQLSEDEAVQHYWDTGENLGTFATPEDANNYADQLHLRQDRVYNLPITPPTENDTRVEQRSAIGRLHALIAAVNDNSNLPPEDEAWFDAPAPLQPQASEPLKKRTITTLRMDPITNQPVADDSDFVRPPLDQSDISEAATRAEINRGRIKPSPPPKTPVVTFTPSWGYQTEFQKRNLEAITGGLRSVPGVGNAIDLITRVLDDPSGLIERPVQTKEVHPAETSLKPVTTSQSTVKPVTSVSTAAAVAAPAAPLSNVKPLYVVPPAVRSTRQVSVQVANPAYAAWVRGNAGMGSVAKIAAGVGAGGVGGVSGAGAVGGRAATAPVPMTPPPPKYITQTKTIEVVTQPGQRQATAPKTPISGDRYTIQPGDTLGSIARRSGKTVEELARENGIADPNKIRAGATIRVGGSIPLAPSTGNRTQRSAQTAANDNRQQAANQNRTFKGTATGKTYQVGKVYTTTRGTKVVATADGKFKPV